MARYQTLCRSDTQLSLRWNEYRPAAINETWCRVLRVGVCGTDLQILRGSRPDKARVLGHEGIGFTPWPAKHDGSYMKQSANVFIFNPVDYGDQDHILGHSYDGLFAESALVPTKCLTPFDINLPTDLGPLVEPLATVIYSWQLLSSRSNSSTLGIWGAGSTAMLAALAASLRGVRANVFHRRKQRLLWLQSMNADFGAALHPVPTKGYGRLPSVKLDAAMICVPRECAAVALEQALCLVRDGGSIDLFGGFSLGDRSTSLPGVDLGQLRRKNVCGQGQLEMQLFSSLTGKRIWVTGHRGTSRAQLETAQELLAGHTEAFARIISDVISLEAAMTLLPDISNRASKREFLKIVIDPTMPDAARRPDA